jgi:membrane protein implicated in regulation of membrane protease activity
MEILAVVAGIIGLILTYLFLRKFGMLLFFFIIGIVGIYGMYKGVTLGGGWWVGGVVGAIASLISGSSIMHMIKTGEYNSRDTGRRLARDEYIEKLNAEAQEGGED